MPDYWNHNTAYHPWILRAVAERPVRDALDVGCGDGLLLARLAPLVDTATGLEPDPGTYERARVRLADVDNVTVRPCSFEDWGAGAGSIDLVTMVASLHHMDLTGRLRRHVSCCAPAGNCWSSDWRRTGVRPTGSSPGSSCPGCGCSPPYTGSPRTSGCRWPRQRRVSRKSGPRRSGSSPASGSGGACTTATCSGG